MSHRWTIISPHGDIPSPKWRHTTILFDDSLFIFGGISKTKALNEFHKFHIPSKTFTKIENKMNPLGSLCGIVYNDSIIFFGGEVPRQIPSNKMFEYKIFENKWREIKYEGHVPGLCGYSIIEYQGLFYVYGGWDGLNINGKLYIFDYKHQKWKLGEQSGRIPRKRSRHAACKFKDHLIIHGGNDFGYLLQDLWKLNLNTLEWKLIHSLNPIGPKVNHNVFTINGKLYIYGGTDSIDANDKYFPELHELIFDEEMNFCTFRLIETWNHPPAFCSCDALPYKGDVYFFGGKESFISTNVMRRINFVNEYGEKLYNLLGKSKFVDVEIIL